MANEEPLVVVKACVNIVWKVVREDGGDSRYGVVGKGEASLCRGGRGSVCQGTFGTEDGHIGRGWGICGHRVSRLCYFARTTFYCYLFLYTLCTILRPQDTTPRITCDSKSPMTDKLGPPVRPRFPVRYLIDSRAWPSPLWAHNAFSYVLLLSLQTHIVSFFQSLLFDSVPFRSIAPLISFTSIRFYSIPFDPFLRQSLSYPRSPSLVVYKPLYDLGGALSLT